MSTLREDVVAGFSVALVALPLSIGIALASGAPASAGLIAAIVGGLLGSWMGGTQVTINGPAAGLIVIVLDAVMSLGQGDPMKGFKGMLAAAVVAGVIQIGFGLLKFGRKCSAFPVSVIHGMMAAIGVIILAKQIHVLLGHTPQSKNPIMLFTEIPHAITHLNPVVAFTGIASLLVLALWPKLPWNGIKKVPAALLVVGAGAFITAQLNVQGQVLLNIPSDLSKWIIFPDFSVMLSFAGWKAAITLALVASLETVLSAAAVDKLDPWARRSDLDRDLLSKGVCNMLSATVGGLPMIAEIVRSSANVSYGAKTWKANFSHGLLILAAVLVFPSALSLIPLSCLAAILVMVGSRLGSPKHFMHAIKVGKDNAVGFIVCMFGTLAFDLLIGIFAGAIAQYLVEMAMGLKMEDTFKPRFKFKLESEWETFTVESALTFSNFLVLKEEITSWIAQGKNVRLELTNSDYIDHSVIDQLEDLKSNFKSKELKFEVVYSQAHKSVGEDTLSARKKAA